MCTCLLLFKYTYTVNAWLCARTCILLCSLKYFSILLCSLFCRKFVDMFRRSRRQLRKSFSRSRSEDQTPPSISSPLLPPPLPLPSSLPVMQQPPSPATQIREENWSVKEKVQDWIQNNSNDFLKLWKDNIASLKCNSGLEVFDSLQKTSELLDPNSSECLNAINVSRGGKRIWVESFVVLIRSCIHCSLTPLLVCLLLSSCIVEYPLNYIGTASPCCNDIQLTSSYSSPHHLHSSTSFSHLLLDSCLKQAVFIVTVLFLNTFCTLSWVYQ